MSEARTKLDILYQDVVGDVSSLLSRIEAISAALSLQPEQINRTSKKLGESLTIAANTTARRINAEFEKSCIATLQDLRAITQEAKSAARIVEGASKRFSTIALVLGIFGGILGGAFIAMLLVN